MSCFAQSGRAGDMRAAASTTTHDCRRSTNIHTFPRHRRGKVPEGRMGVGLATPMIVGGFAGRGYDGAKRNPVFFAIDTRGGKRMVALRAIVSMFVLERRQRVRVGTHPHPPFGHLPPPVAREGMSMRRACLPRHRAQAAPRHQAMMPFWACRRFSASSHTTDCGPSITSAVTSSPRWAGRQCMKTASFFAIAISLLSTW